MTTNELHRLQSRSFAGKRPGPRLLITAGVHGDEFLPMLAVRELIRRFDTDDQWTERLCGSLTLIPIVNRSAYHRGDRCGNDEKDLARSCPGSDAGSVTERLAFELSREIQRSDFYIDLHTGGKELCVHPLAGYVLHRDPSVLARQRSMARAFQLPFLWGTSDGLQGRTLSVARDAGIPAIYVEYLGGHRELAEVASGTLNHGQGSDHPLVSGCLDVMRHLEMIPTRPDQGVSQEIVEDWRDGSGHMQVCNPAPASGFLTLKVKLGQQVGRGDLLAEIDSETDSCRHLVTSEQVGTVVVVRDYPRINQGDTVAVIAEDWSKQ